MKRIIAALVLLVACVGLNAKDIKTLTVTTDPEMHCQNCEKRIKSNIRFVKGVKKIETSLEQQTVTITYDADKTSESAIIDAFNKISYSATKCEGKADTQQKK